MFYFFHKNFNLSIYHPCLNKRKNKKKQERKERKERRKSVLLKKIHFRAFISYFEKYAI